MSPSIVMAFVTHETLASEDPAVLVAIRDSEGNVARRLTAPNSAGIHRAARDLRCPDLVLMAYKQLFPGIEMPSSEPGPRTREPAIP